MVFPIVDLMDERACYQRLMEVLHPQGLCCPNCGSISGLGVHRRHRDPVLDYQCSTCGRVFNIWTATLLQGTHKRPSQVILILRAIAVGTSTAELARELGLQRPHLLELRHRLQALAELFLDRRALSDSVVEADEMYQNAGEKRACAPQNR